MADVHLKTSPTTPEWKIKEQDDCLRCVNVYAVKQGIKDIIVAGDVFDHHNPDSDSLQFFLDWIKLGVESGLRYWIIPGNHDASDKMCSKHSMSSIRQTLDIVDAGYKKGFNIIDKTHVLSGDFFRGFRIYFIPWMEDEAYVKAVKRVGKSAASASEIPILATHCFIKGSQVGDGGYKHQEGIDVKVFDPFHYVALGDIHLRQEFKTKKGMAYYPGSLICQNFGERKEKKGFLDVTITPDSAEVKFVAVPHVTWTQRRIKSSVLMKMVVSGDLFNRKFPRSKFAGKNLKLIIDCEGGKSSSQPIDALVERSKKMGLVNFEWRMANTGYARVDRFKSKKTGSMMDEMVDSDKAVKKKQKKKAKQVGKQLLERTSR